MGRGTEASIDWNYGDIAVYYGKGGDTNASYNKYGHAQMYVGDLVGSKWATSTKNNYGTSFVYNSKPQDCWDFWIFRAPQISTGYYDSSTLKL